MATDLQQVKMVKLLKQTAARLWMIFLLFLAIVVLWEWFGKRGNQWLTT